MNIKHIVVFIYGLILVGFFAGNITLPSTLASVYQHSFPLPASTANLLTVIYLLCYYLLQIPAGIMIDRTSISASIYLSLGLFCLSFIIFSLSTNPSILAISRIIMAIGACFSYILAVYAAGKLFAKKFYTMLIGIAEIVFALSIAIAPLLLKTLSYYFSWHSVLISLAIFTVLLGIFYFFINLNQPMVANSNATKMTTNHYRKMIISNGNFWFISIVGGIFYTHFIIFNEIYAPTYIQKVYHTHYISSVFLNDSGLFGYMIGCLCLGAFERLLSARRSFFIAALLSSLLYSMIVFAHPLLMNSVVLRYTIYFFLGFLTAFALLAFRLYQVYNRKTADATTTACINIILSLIPLALFNIYVPLLGVDFSYGRIFLFGCYLATTILAIRFLFKPKDER